MRATPRTPSATPTTTPSTRPTWSRSCGGGSPDDDAVGTVRRVADRPARTPPTSRRSCGSSPRECPDPERLRGEAMHVWSVTPIHVEPGELARRQARYDALSPAGIRVELVDIGTDAPRQLATEQDVRDSEGLVADALRDAPDRADALMPDCFLDPGVAELSATLWSVPCSACCAPQPPGACWPAAGSGPSPATLRSPTRPGAWWGLRLRLVLLGRRRARPRRRRDPRGRPVGGRAASGGRADEPGRCRRPPQRVQRRRPAVGRGGLAGPRGRPDRPDLCA